MKKLAVLFLSLVSFSVFAQEVAANPTPWEGTKYGVLITLTVTTGLGLLSKLAYKIPGKFGDIVRWLLDVLSANVEHK